MGEGILSRRGFIENLMAKDNPSHPSKLRLTPLKAGEEFYYNI